MWARHRFPVLFSLRGFFWGRFFLATLARLHIALNIIITFVVTMFIIKVGYDVTPRPYPIFSRICWLFSFLVFLLTFGKCRNFLSVAKMASLVYERENYFAAIHHLKSSPTFSVRPCSSVGRVTVDLIRRSWVRFPPRSKDFFFASCGSLFPFTRANAQWVIHGFK